MEYSEIYVKRIRQLCKERGFAINKLAKRAGINQSTLVFMACIEQDLIFQSHLSLMIE